MKLGKIAGPTKTTKVSLVMNVTTRQLLDEYRACYIESYGSDVQFKDMVEMMLKTYMSEDKAFQKFLKRKLDRVQVTDQVPSPVAPAVSE